MFKGEGVRDKKELFSYFGSLVVYVWGRGGAVVRPLACRAKVTGFKISSEPLLSILQFKGTRYQAVHDIVRMLVHKRLITGSRTVYFPGS